MNIGTGIFGGLALIAISIAATGNGEIGAEVARAAEVDDEASGKGVWAFRGHGAQLIIWKMNTESGDLFACSLEQKGCVKVGTPQ
jgi:hypothetical protein